MPKKELTPPFLRGHDSAPENKRIEYYDTIVDGLTCRITSKGSKTFSYRYRVAGRQKRFTIGKFPTIGVAEARDIARDLAKKVSMGFDPQRKKLDKRDDLTIKELAEVYKEKHFPKLKESTQDDYRNRIDEVIIPALGSIHAKDLEIDDIIDLLEYIADDREAPIQSNRVRAILSSIYSFAQKYRYVKINPVLSVPKFGEEKSSDRFYNEDEIRIIWDNFSKIKEPTGSLMKFLLITGQRLGETRQFKWEYLNDGVWTIPEKLTKAKRQHEVPLHKLALEIIEKMKIYSGDSVYVFESPVNEKQPVTWVQWAPRRVREAEVGVSDFKIHDLRRTVATHLAKLKVNRTIIGKVLNHKEMAGDNHVTATYDRHDYMKEKHDALYLWDQKLQKIITKPSSSKAEGATIYHLR